MEPFKSLNNLIGLSLKVGPLGENDRLLTILSEEKGISRIAIPGARRPKSSLAATAPLTLLQLNIIGKKGLLKARHIKVLKSFSKLGERIETLAAAQALSELSLMLFGNNDPQNGALEMILIHLQRLESIGNKQSKQLETLAKSIQSCIHLLALGGYCIPIQRCCQTGLDLIPPIGNWEWRCSLIPEEGLAIGSIPFSKIQLNPSELALLQRLLKPNLPLKRNGEIMGPQQVWLKLLIVVQSWIETHLPNKLHSLNMLQEVILSSDINENEYIK
tara:strand:+ start:378 stop:1199 length:822 start_codon:yes stop_codon:yes gene_type:complete